MRRTYAAKAKLHLISPIAARLSRRRAVILRGNQSEGHTSFIPVLVVTAMTLCAFGGLLSFKQYVLSKDVLWIVAGYSLYSLSNVLWIISIDQNGMVRALIVASAANILLTTAAGYALGEKIGVVGLVAAALSCLAAGLSLIGAHSTEVPPTSPPQTKSETHV